MDKPVAPCFMCKDMIVGCHGTCAKYKQFERDNKEYKECIRKQRNDIHLINSAIIEGNQRRAAIRLRRG